MKQRTKPETSLLPTDRAFVVQFTVATNVQRRRIAGRVEHVMSGHSAHFQSLQELLAFIAQVLSEKQGKEDP
jgi:hypothetical protein